MQDRELSKVKLIINLAIARSNFDIPLFLKQLQQKLGLFKMTFVLVGCIINWDCMEVITTMQDGGNTIGPAVAIYEECSFLSRGFSMQLFAVVLGKALE